MKFKALLTGAASIIFLGLLLQLFFLLAATGYTILLKEYPSWKIALQPAAYFATGFAYFMIMSFSGYLTASLAQKNIYLHAFIVSLFCLGLSLITSVREDGFTLNSIIFIISGIFFTISGAYFWQRSTTVITGVEIENSASKKEK